MIRSARPLQRTEPTRLREARGGFALVAVLSVMALMSGMLLGLSLWSRNSVENAAVAAADLSLDRLARSAATVAAYQFFVLKLTRERIDSQQLKLDGATATITLGDDGGKVDLNGSDLPLLAAAYRAAGLSRMTPEAFAARVADWRDEDDTEAETGAETPTYRNAGLPPPRNGKFRTVSDLRQVIGMDQADVIALSPFLTVFNPSGHLNVYTAPLTLIRALTDASPASFAELKSLIEAPRSEQSLVRMQSRLTDYPLLTTDLIDFIRLQIDIATAEIREARRYDIVIRYSKGGKRIFQLFEFKVSMLSAG